MDTRLSYELHDAVATIALDDGKANAMGLPMLQALNAALDRAEADKAAVVVIRGRPGMFCGGFDLATFKADPGELLQMLEAGARLTERLLGFPAPTIAVCTGHAIAMGAFLLLSADLRIGIDQGARIQVNEVQIGLTLPYFAIEVCRQRLTPAHFNLATLTARPYSPSEAVAAGFLDEVVAADALAATAQSRANSLRSLNAEAFAATKRRLRASSIAALRDATQQDIAEWAERFRRRT
jgi:enoyl-CoA hydratase